MSAAPGKMAVYALAAALEMAAAGDDRPVAVGQVARSTRVPEAVLAKAFQHLVRAGLAIGVRGSAGGYRLARPAAKITVLDVLEAFEPPRPSHHGDPRPARSRRASRRAAPSDAAARALPDLDPRIRRLFHEVDELVRCTYASVSLATLAAQR